MRPLAMGFGCLLLSACAPGQDVDASIGTYCADLCFSDPGWLEEQEQDPWECTLACEQNPSISQEMLSCLGNEGTDSGLEICELLLSEQITP